MLGLQADVEVKVEESKSECGGWESGEPTRRVDGNAVGQQQECVRLKKAPKKENNFNVSGVFGTEISVMTKNHGRSVRAAHA